MVKLDKKKELASRTLKVGKKRIAFNLSRLDEVKEAITKQDIKDLKSDGAIIVKEISGRRKIVKRKTRRRVGSRKLTPNRRKQDYVKLTRKLRLYLAHLKKQGKLSNELFIHLRKGIRASSFKSLAQLKERIEGFEQ